MFTLFTCLTKGYQQLKLSPQVIVRKRVALLVEEDATTREHPCFESYGISTD